MTIPTEYAFSALVVAMLVGFIAGVKVCAWVAKRNGKVPA